MIFCRRLASRDADTGASPAAALRGCPFCGAPAAVEAHPRLPEAVRIACGGAACAVRPATEYLLAEYMGELRSAWNRRPAR